MCGRLARNDLMLRRKLASPWIDCDNMCHCRYESVHFFLFSPARLKSRCFVNGVEQSWPFSSVLSNANGIRSEKIKSHVSDNRAMQVKWHTATLSVWRCRLSTIIWMWQKWNWCVWVEALKRPPTALDVIVRTFSEMHLLYLHTELQMHRMWALDDWTTDDDKHMGLTIGNWTMQTCGLRLIELNLRNKMQTISCHFGVTFWVYRDVISQFTVVKLSDIDTNDSRKRSFNPYKLDQGHETETGESNISAANCSQSRLGLETYVWYLPIFLPQLIRAHRRNAHIQMIENLVLVDCMNTSSIVQYHARCPTSELNW